MRAWLRRRFWNWDTLVVVPLRPDYFWTVWERALYEDYLPALREQLNRKPLLLQMLEERPVPGRKRRWGRRP